MHTPVITIPTPEADSCFPDARKQWHFGMSIWATLKVTRMIVATTRCTRRRHRRRTPPAPARGPGTVRAGHAICQSGLRRQKAAQWRDTHQSVCVQARGFRGPLSESGSDTGCEAESAPPSSPSLFSTTHSLCLCVVCGIVSHCSREEHPAPSVSDSRQNANTRCEGDRKRPVGRFRHSRAPCGKGLWVIFGTDARDAGPL